MTISPTDLWLLWPVLALCLLGIEIRLLRINGKLEGFRAMSSQSKEEPLRRQLKRRLFNALLWEVC
jgi:hypothetical protein